MQRINRQVCDGDECRVRNNLVEETRWAITTTATGRLRKRRVWPNPLGTHTRLRRQNGWRINRHIYPIGLGAQNALQGDEITRDTDSVRRRSVLSRR